MAVAASGAVTWMCSSQLVNGRCVNGRVLVDGQPARAYVYLMPGGSPQGPTDAAGRFSLEVYWDDPIDLWVSAGTDGGWHTPIGGAKVPPWWNRPACFDVELTTGNR